MLKDVLCPANTCFTSYVGLAAVRRQLAFGELSGSSSMQQALVTNTLGTRAALLTDLGDRQTVVELGPYDEGVPVLLAPPGGAAAGESRATGLAPPRVPAVSVFVDALGLEGLPRDLLGEGGLMVKIKVRAGAVCVGVLRCRLGCYAVGCPVHMTLSTALERGRVSARVAGVCSSGLREYAVRCLHRRDGA